MKAPPLPQSEEQTPGWASGHGTGGRTRGHRQGRGSTQGVRGEGGSRAEDRLWQLDVNRKEEGVELQSGAERENMKA